MNNPIWQWDKELGVGYLDLYGPNATDAAKTHENWFPNVTINVDVDDTGRVVGIELIS